MIVYYGFEGEGRSLLMKNDYFRKTDKKWVFGGEDLFKSMEIALFDDFAVVVVQVGFDVGWVLMLVGISSLTEVL